LADDFIIVIVVIKLWDLCDCFVFVDVTRSRSSHHKKHKHSRHHSQHKQQVDEDKSTDNSPAAETVADKQPVLWSLHWSDFHFDVFECDSVHGRLIYAYTVSLKSFLNIFDCNFKKNYQISVIFW